MIARKFKSHSLWLVAFAVLGALLGAVSCQSASLPKSTTALPLHNPLSRDYHEGEKIAYRMTATNQANHYEIQADSMIEKDASGHWLEEIAWSHAILNDKPTELSPACAAFRQCLSLVPGATLSVSDLSQVSALIGPITDLLTFYADYKIASSQASLTKAGDHATFSLAMAPSWADGTRIILGEDSIDFDITLKDISPTVATILVRHVPPAKPLIKLPAEWMRVPVADTPNNWIEVEKNQDGTFSARIGKETFNVEIKVDVTSGRIVSGRLDNWVEVLERKCADAALTKPGDPTRYQIKRQIEIRVISP